MSNHFRRLQQNKNAEKEFYNLIIEGQEEDYIHDFYYVKHHQYMIERAMHFAVELIRKKNLNNLKIFEVGSGGDFYRALRNAYPERNISVTIGDIAIMQLMRNNILANKVNLDLESLPFKNRSFDFIYIRGTLHHFPVIDVCSKELIRVCSSSIIITNEPCGNNPVVVLSRWVSRLLSHFVEIDTTVNETMHSMKTYKSNFYKYGAKHVTAENGDEIFSDKESWDSFLSGIRNIHSHILRLFILIRAHLLRIMMLNFPKYPFGWNTFLIFVER